MKWEIYIGGIAVLCMGRVLSSKNRAANAWGKEMNIIVRNGSNNNYYSLEGLAYGK